MFYTKKKELEILEMLGPFLNKKMIIINQREQVVFGIIIISNIK